MNEYIAAALKGVVEGLTEFVPVSSTGHLIIARDWMPIPEHLENGFDIFIQLGAILAVAVCFRKRLWKRTVTVFKDAESTRFALALFIGLIPAAIVGLSCHDFVEKHMMTNSVVAVSLLAGGVIMLLIELIPLKIRFKDPECLPLRIAFYIGVFQCLAILFPGASRSGATIVGALAIGVSRTAAAEFSFFLALPTLFAATSYSFLKLITEISLSINDLVILGIGFVVSFIVGWIAIDLLLKFLRKHTLIPFGIYRIVMGIVLLCWFIKN